MSEPHTSELNGGIFPIYVYIYRTYVHCTRSCAAYGQYAHDLKTRAYLDTFIIQLFRISRFRVVVVNIDILNASRRAPKPSQDKTGYDNGENGLDLRQRQPSIGRKD